MNTKHQVHNLIILDESGSMYSIKESILQGLNEIVQTIKGIEKQFPEQEHFISFMSFNGLGHKIHHFIDPASKLQELDSASYDPDASTPLYDAMGFSINKLKKSLEGVKDYNVLVTIMTDGEENSSKEFSGKDIKNLVEELKQNRWTFTYIGTDHDVEKIAFNLSINNSWSFGKNKDDIDAMFLKERQARTNYSQKIRSNKDTTSNYFDEEEEKK